MCTVLITYSTPEPPGEPAGPAPVDVDGRDAREPREVPSTPSFAATTAGIDEAIAATVADELTRAGHRVACRPSVAVTTTTGFDLVVDVRHLRVSHRAGGRPRPVDPPVDRPIDRPVDRTKDQPDVASTIPMTWCADWRAVDAWARSVGDHLVHVLELRTELSRVRAELDRCRTLLLAATPEARGLSAPELGRQTTGGSAQNVHRPHRRTQGKQTTGA